MLKNAIDYERQLFLESFWITKKEEYKYFVFDIDNECANAKYIKLYKRDNYFEFVSVDDKRNEIIGFFRYYVDNNKAMNIETICFNNNKSFIYGLDIFRLLKYIFTKQKLEEINFSVNSDFEYLNKKYNDFIKKGLGQFVKDKSGWKFYKVNRDNYLEYIHKKN